MITALICDHHRLFAETFAGALRAAGADVRVAADPGQALESLSSDPADRVVMSLHFPDQAGPAAIRQIRLRWPLTHVSSLGGAEPAVGVSAALCKTRPLAELVEAVVRGGTTPPRVIRPRPPIRTARVDAAILAARFLTDRERDVLKLLVGAQPTLQIADELGISVTTTRGYVQSILSKLGVHSRIEAVSYAVRHSVVS
ncbi:response regulator transcription factor [Actinoplanes solisilvae]|uniref:response regulator transcription factor n=1 Tax=Actinoplanes solisilvae TaxID=2486853 RepID=UPI000FDC8374|nr:response regulator transcription factor [Actinoplanes solisilvae]